MNKDIVKFLNLHPALKNIQGGSEKVKNKPDGGFPNVYLCKKEKEIKKRGFVMINKSNISLTDLLSNKKKKFI
jgi:hypothetical protein